MNSQTSIPVISHELYSEFERCISSEVVELVTKDSGRFFVHKDILSYQSQPFADATSGSWKESAEHKIHLQDWDSATVARLVQFLYTGDYKYPHPTPISTGGSSPSVDDQSPVETPHKPRSVENRPLTPLDKCVVGALPTPGKPRTSDSDWLDRMDITAFNFQETILAHAEVYTLAQYKLVDALRVLAQQRLSRVLLRLHPLTPKSHLITQVVDLVTYVYANTDTLSSSQEPLRNVISHFVALNFAAWQSDLRAVEMMCNGGDFVRDVLAKLARRLGGSGERNVATPGTRFIMLVRCVHQETPPPEYIPEIDSSTGSVKQPEGRSVWLVPEYTTTAEDAATRFQISQTTGLTMETIVNGGCRGACHLQSVSSKEVPEKLTELAIVRCSNGFLDISAIRSYDGIATHIAHSGYGEDFHVVWKSVMTAAL